MCSAVSTQDLWATLRLLDDGQNMKGLKVTECAKRFSVYSGHHSNSAKRKPAGISDGATKYFNRYEVELG